MQLSMFNFSKIDERIMKTQEKKIKIDKDNFKKKLFLLNKREFVNDIRE